VRLEAVSHQRPEGLKSLGRYVGEPEAEEHHVMETVGDAR
jgi:hypothetical protein